MSWTLRIPINPPMNKIIPARPGTLLVSDVISEYILIELWSMEY